MTLRISIYLSRPREKRRLCYQIGVKHGALTTFAVRNTATEFRISSYINYLLRNGINPELALPACVIADSSHSQQTS